MSIVQAAASSVCGTWFSQMRASFWTVRGDLCRNSPSEHHLTHVSDSGFQPESPISSDHTMSGSPATLQHILHSEVFPQRDNILAQFPYFTRKENPTVCQHV
jgi:hypothetical protein